MARWHDVRWLVLGIVVGCGPQVDVDPSSTSGADGDSGDTGSASATSTGSADDSGPVATTAPPPPPPMTTSPPPPMTTAGDDASDSDPTDATTGAPTTEGCVAPSYTCMTGCEALYDCGVVEGCAFSGTDDERVAFVDGCQQNPLCASLVQIVDECDCLQTVETVSAASPDFDQLCTEGF